MTTQHTKQPENSTTQSDLSSNGASKSGSCYPGRRTPLTMSAGADVHTTELTDSCLRRVLLRHEQKIRPAATTALFRGLLAGKALEFVHDGDNYDTLDHAMGLISRALCSELEDEGRIISDSVIKNMSSIQEDVLRVVEQYINRFMPLFEQCELIGTELPCRLFMGGTNYASHLDLLVRDTNNVFGYGQGRLLCIDWKYRQEVPTKAYLSRNLQFFLYWLTIKEGSVMAYPAVDGWIDYGEVPQMIWCHLPNMKPFGRKTTSKDGDGNPVVYSKGDERPITSILKAVNFLDDPDVVSEMKKDMADRVEMMRSGFFPKSPDPVGCQVCEAQDFCSRGDTPIIMENT